MSKKSSLITEQQSYDTAIQMATEVLSATNTFTQSIKPTDLVSGSAMGEEEGWKYVEKAFEALTNKRNLVLEELVDYDVFEAQINNVKKLLALKKLYGNWIGDMQPTFILLGKHLMKHAKYIKDALKTLSDRTSEYKPAYETINKLYDERSKKKEATQTDKKRISDLEKHIQGLESKIQETTKKSG
jgi:hypothetical protein